MLRLVLVDDGEVVGVPTSAQYMAATPIGDGRRSIKVDGRLLIIETHAGHPRTLTPEVRAHEASRRPVSAHTAVVDRSMPDVCLKLVHAEDEQQSPLLPPSD